MKITVVHSLFLLTAKESRLKLSKPMSPTWKVQPCSQPCHLWGQRTPLPLSDQLGNGSVLSLIQQSEGTSHSILPWVFFLLIDQALSAQPHQFWLLGGAGQADLGTTPQTTSFQFNAAEGKCLPYLLLLKAGPPCFAPICLSKHCRKPT